jgi:hypothetical protein
MKSTLLLITATLTMLMITSCSPTEDWKQDTEYDPQGAVITRTYIWHYDGHTFAHEFAFKRADYEYYLHLPKDQPYSSYCMDHTGHRYIIALAKELDSIAAQQRYSGMALAGFIVSFVHSIPYRSDPARLDGGDWPKYPIETIIEHGDCEDVSQLDCALLSTLGFDVVLVSMPEARHMAAAIACSSCYPCYVHNGKRYGFIEAVPCDLSIGQMPKEYVGQSATLLDVPHTSSYIRPLTHYHKPKVIDQPDQEDDMRDKVIHQTLDEVSQHIIDSCSIHLDTTISGAYARVIITGRIRDE